MLTSSQIRFLRARAHRCHPVVRLGQKGLTDAVVGELERALKAHELVKVRLASADRERRAAWIASLREHTGAELVQAIGHTVSLFRRNPDHPRIDLPEA